MTLAPFLERSPRDPARNNMEIRVCRAASNSRHGEQLPIETRERLDSTKENCLSESASSSTTEELACNCKQQARVFPRAGIIKKSFAEGERHGNRLIGLHSIRIRLAESFAGTRATTRASPSRSRKRSGRIRRCSQKWQVTTAVRNATERRASSAPVTAASRSARYDPVSSSLHLARTTLRIRVCPRTGHRPPWIFIQLLSPNPAPITQPNYTASGTDRQPAKRGDGEPEICRSHHDATARVVQFFATIRTTPDAPRMVQQTPLRLLQLALPFVF